MLYIPIFPVRQGATHPPRKFSILGFTMIRTPLISLLIHELSLINFIPRNLFEQIKFFIEYPIRVVPPYFIVYDPLISLTTDVLHDAIAGIIDWFIIIALILQ